MGGGLGLRKWGGCDVWFVPVGVAMVMVRNEVCCFGRESKNAYRLQS